MEFKGSSNQYCCVIFLEKIFLNKMDSSLNSKEQLEKKYAIGDTIGVKILKIEEQSQKLAFILPSKPK